MNLGEQELERWLGVKWLIWNSRLPGTVCRGFEGKPDESQRSPSLSASPMGIEPPRTPRLLALSSSPKVPLSSQNLIP